ncbi:hypothetical protein [uncultured Aquimarina sp.]|uniref:hypothetical protein n=1 Tax=uncultured Aquimarina sp. TaxID=575652 RepID=UPI00260C7056|nr:hypothetical protein [uncultured Aquimarina sp.]
MKQKTSVKQILNDLISIKSQLKKYYANSKKHKTLLKFLIHRDFEEGKYPMLKDIEKETGLSTYKLRKQLKEIHESVFDYETGHIFDFSTFEITINVSYYKRYASFKCNNLGYIPREGESVEIPFLKAKIGIYYFYVEKVMHYFINSTHFIDIDLKGGLYNSYWSYRLDKAIELEEIEFGDQFDLAKYQIKEKLGLDKRRFRR